MRTRWNCCARCCRQLTTLCLRWKRQATSAGAPTRRHRPLLLRAGRRNLHSEGWRKRLVAADRRRWHRTYRGVSGQCRGYHRSRRQLLRRLYCRAGPRVKHQRGVRGGFRRRRAGGDRDGIGCRRGGLAAYAGLYGGKPARVKLRRRIARRQERLSATDRAAARQRHSAGGRRQSSPYA